MPSMDDRERQGPLLKFQADTEINSGQQHDRFESANRIKRLLDKQEGCDARFEAPHM